MINIAKLLEDAQKGMKLYSPLFGDVEYCYIGGTNRRIWVCTKASMRMFSMDGRYCFTHDGNTIESTECLLFPSKECRTWEDFKLSVEPKFKVGDWITNGTFTHYIVSIVDGFYYFYGGGYLDFGKIDGYYHLWTIADAKDGDVITNGKLIVIFNKLEEPAYKQRVIAYAGLDLCGRLQITEDTWQLGVDKAMPATKEQRDLLFQKMEENGYKWDADKKELHKIKHYDISSFYAGMPVLVRDSNKHKWKYVVFSHNEDKSSWGYKFNAAGTVWQQCIPFNEETKHLLGTTDMPSEEYINW